MEYRHIRDCWNALRDVEPATIETYEKLLGEFPRWSGHWALQITDENEKICSITNMYVEYGEQQIDEESFDFSDKDKEVEEYQVQYANSEGDIFDGGTFKTFGEAKKAAIDGYHTDEDYAFFVIYNKAGDIVFSDEDLTDVDPDEPIGDVIYK